MINRELINPQSIVVVGGSNNVHKPGGRLVRNLLDGKYKGELYVVNAKEDDVQGLKSYHSVHDIPETELAIISIPGPACPEAVDVLAKQKNVKAFIVISAGFGEETHEGANQHPSQTMLDLYSIRKTQGKLDNLTITMVGDLKYGRTVHSLIVGMSHFHPTFHFVAPNELRMPDEQKNFCDKHGLKYEEHTDFTEDIINQTDILYMTRVQRERFTDLEEYERVKNVYILRNDMLRNSRENLRILHPLPRVNEIAYDVDDNPKAYYIQQARNGLFARQAIICEVLGISIDE